MVSREFWEMNTTPSDGAPPSGNDALVDAIIQGIADDEEENQSFNDEFFWQDAVLDTIEDDLKKIGKEYGMDTTYLEGWFNGQKDNLINYLDQSIGPDAGAPVPGGVSYGLNPNNPRDVQVLIDGARNWVGTKIPGFTDAVNVAVFNKGGGGGGGGGGRGSSTADIRAQFDLDELTRAVNDMARGLILSEFSGARSLAKAYVDQIVANPGQNLDFETFARKQILNSARAKTIYKDKPDSLSHEQFLQPYVQSAMQVIGPGHGDQLAEVATGGARLGADPNAFRARLQRTRQAQSSAPFLQNLGDQVSQVKRVLR